jgi:hypothetical protein
MLLAYVLGSLEPGAVVNLGHGVVFVSRCADLAPAALPLSRCGQFGTCHLCLVQVSEGLLRLLLPYILGGLEPGAMVDHRAAAFMVIAQLATKATLGAQLLSGAKPPC